MSGRVIQGLFVGGRPRPVAQPRAVAPSASRPGPPAALAGRPPLVHQAIQVAQAFGADDSFEVDPAHVGLGRSVGQPLPHALLAKMEAAFGADFSGVRVHVGPQAARIGAVAFTMGDDLYFAPGKFQPDSAQGQQLIGHELAHVIQQRQGRVRAPGAGVTVVQDRALEAEADRLGMRAALTVAPPRFALCRQPVRSAPTRLGAVQRKPDFVIPAHFTGEQYITKAALLLNPTSTVTVFSDAAAIEVQYRKDAALIGVNFFEMYNRRHNTPCTSDAEAKAHLIGSQKRQLDRTVAYMRSGLADADRRVRISPRPLGTMTTGSTQAVRDAFAANPRSASEAILRNIQGSLDWETCVEIRRFFGSKGFEVGGKYVLFWGRRSGEMLGAGAYLDTNEQMIAQMMVTIRKRDPTRRFVLIGDQIDIPATIDGLPVPAIDIDLVAYWRRGLPGDGDVNAQFYFLNYLKIATDTVAVGTNSGILEIPHLLGMATVYLENVHLHKRKGLRWQLLASKYEFKESEGEIRSLIKRQEGAKDLRRKAELGRRLASTEMQKVVVGGKLRPRLVRFSTTGATELWVLRKQVLGEIKAWILASRETTVDSVGPTPQRVLLKATQDDLLKLIVRCEGVSDLEATPDGQRLSYVLLHDVKRRWGAINVSRELCLCPIELKRMAVLAIDKLIRRHALTAQEIRRFWETFNYTYVNDDLSAAPDYRAGMRAWLRDSEEVWNQVKNKGRLGSRVDQIKAAIAREAAEERAAAAAAAARLAVDNRRWLASNATAWAHVRRRAGL
ncbi:DUF4157 domain-containing protein [Phenylobacterium sp.]|uniref:eCIS core domain-containing protein n=1 Tax=Phenylobacterium sp. TaxID=1871053 RepID=UPI003D27679D